MSKIIIVSIQCIKFAAKFENAHKYLDTETSLELLLIDKIDE